MQLTPFRQAAPHAPRVEGSIALSNEPDGLHAFDSETDPRPRPEPPKPPVADLPGRRPAVRPFKLQIPHAALPLAIVGALGVATGAAGLWVYQRAIAMRSLASLRIETSVPGAEVFVAGNSAGKTPISLSLAAGSYPIQLALDGARREFKVDLSGGTSVVRHVDMPITGDLERGAAVGSLLVQTEPSRLPISVDGVDRGRSPLTLAGLKPGEHQVVVRAEGAVVRRTVSIQPNEHTVLVVSPVERSAPAPTPATAGGWLAVASPVALTIRENGRVVGSTEVERLMLPAGEHELQLSNELLGFQTTRSIRIEAGKTAALKVEPPNGSLSINAQPWAEVWVDGRRIGDTPIGKLPQPIGTHEVLLRHPDLGEKRETVTVTLREIARLGVDMRRK